MDWIAGPAVLGGIIMSVALGSWALGRWQRDFVASQDSGAGEPACAGTAPPDVVASDIAAPVMRMPAQSLPTPSRPVPSSQHTAPAARRSQDQVAALGELHAEISAYRRTEQVLATLDSDPLRLTAFPQSQRTDCRYLGLIGEPTCAMIFDARPASGCTSGSGCAGYNPRVSVQPAVPVSSLTRV